MANASAASHAVAVLQLLARQAEPLPAATIARRIGLPRSSTYHLLGVLRESGFVSHLADDRVWGLGVAAYELGAAYTRAAPLQRVARPILARLADETGHNVHLAVLHGTDVLYVIEDRAPGRPSLVTDVGVRLPAPLTASGLAILAALPGRQVRALFPSRDLFVQRTGVGPTSLTALRSELARVRQRGHAVEDGSVTLGLSSVAVVVLDHTDHPVASVAITFPSDDPDGTAVRHRLVDAAGRTAAELSHRIGRR